MTMTVQNVSFAGNNDDRHVTASEVGVATGATVGSAKYGANAILGISMAAMRATAKQKNILNKFNISEKDITLMVNDINNKRN